MVVGVNDRGIVRAGRIETTLVGPRNGVLDHAGNLPVRVNEPRGALDITHAREVELRIASERHGGLDSFLDFALRPGPGIRLETSLRVVTINDYTFTSRVQMYDGVPYVTLRRQHREAVGVEPGDVVACTIEINENPDAVDIPAELAAALDVWPEARQAFTRLAPSHQREHARYVADAKRSATRVRRAQKTLENCREWKSPN